jgi:hypothetical protein
VKAVARFCWSVQLHLTATDRTIPTMKKLLAVLVLACGIAAQGEIAVYRASVAYTRIGNGLVQNVAYAGYMIVDLGTTSIVMLHTDAVKKTFKQSEPSVTTADINATAIKQYTVVRFDDGDLVSALAKGPKASVVVDYNAIKQPVVAAIPASFVVTGADLLNDGNGNNATRDYRGALVFDRISTLSANKAGYDAQTYAGVLETTLLSKGYTAIP